jgi:hypothetical protein
MGYFQPADLDVKYDAESDSWYFRVPSLHVIGGGDSSREAAERHAQEAIEQTRAWAVADQVAPDTFSGESASVAGDAGRASSRRGTVA